MGGRIKEVHISHVGLPLKKKFKHTIATRSQSDSIFLKIILDNGAAGYGESLPREYVTGETPESVVENLKIIVKQKLLGYQPDNYGEIPSFVDNLWKFNFHRKLNFRGAARCALELALLDIYGKYFEKPVSSIIGEKANPSYSYSGVIQAGSLQDTIKTSLAFKIFGLRFVKVKVGVGDDILRLKAARGILGKEANIRVDANCAWGKDEAIDKINRLREYNISAVEQPVKAADYAALKEVTDAVPETIIADESLCTVDDAKRLSKIRACNMFNIRVSKCGGLLNSLRIYNIAKEHNIGAQLGCQVGESGLLSAAGWRFASALRDLSFYEGSYGRYLLKEDVTRENVTIRRGGKIAPINGPGLGVNVLDRILDKHTIHKDILT